MLLEDLQDQTSYISVSTSSLQRAGIFYREDYFLSIYPLIFLFLCYLEIPVNKTTQLCQLWAKTEESTGAFSKGPWT